ncbi:hypothetical protein L579_2046 [Pantoea sp. AS-PWVM4]|nr:hypothetical protein L579_2046 [Pantoea sp. AS-PWVM4]
MFRFLLHNRQKSEFSRQQTGAIYRAMSQFPTGRSDSVLLIDQC